MEAYAKLESELCYVLAALLNTRHDTAAIVFFKITNSAARNAILAALLEHIHGATYKIYWHGQPGGGGVQKVPGLFSLINALDGRRNEIVHWHPTETISSAPDGTNTKWEDLRPPFFWARGKATPILTADLDEFIDKAEFVRLSLCKFWVLTRNPEKPSMSESIRATWTRIFQQPVIYPPPEAHPLAPKPKE